MMETAATKPVREDPNCVAVIYNVTIIETGNGQYIWTLLGCVLSRQWSSEDIQSSSFLYYIFIVFSFHPFTLAEKSILHPEGGDFLGVTSLFCNFFPFPLPFSSFFPPRPIYFPCWPLFPPPPPQYFAKYIPLIKIVKNIHYCIFGSSCFPCLRNCTEKR